MRSSNIHGHTNLTTFYFNENKLRHNIKIANSVAIAAFCF